VLADLEGEGYAYWTFNIPACAFNAPHRRARIFVVAHAQSVSNRGDTRDILQKKCGDEEIRGKQGQADEQWDAPRDSGTTVADTQGKRTTAAEQPGSGHGLVKSSQDVAYPDSSRQLQSQGAERSERGWVGNGGEDVSYAHGKGLQGRRVQGPIGNGGKAMADAHGQQALRASVSWQERNPWAIEPNVGRVAHGVPNRVDRLRALGNAVVPQVAEWLGQQILATEAALRSSIVAPNHANDGVAAKL